MVPKVPKEFVLPPNISLDSMTARILRAKQEDDQTKSATKSVTKVAKTTTASSGEPKARLSLKPAVDMNNLPVFTANVNNIVFTDDDDVEVSRPTRDKTAVYRQVNKVLFITNPNTSARYEGDMNSSK